MNNPAVRSGFRIKDIPVAHPPKHKEHIPWVNGSPSIEDTGTGDILCYEAWGARWFFASEEWVRKSVKEFCENYEDMCKRAAEDPAHQYADVANFNDLYRELGISESTLGDAWGYSTSEDYAVDLEFNMEYVYPTENELADRFGCRIFVIEVKDPSCYPDFYYREY